MSSYRDALEVRWSTFIFSIMVPLAGLILMALGLCLAITSWAEFLAVLRGVAALGCLGFGGILLLVGASERKARREYQDAMTSDPEVEAHPQEAV